MFKDTRCLHNQLIHTHTHTQTNMPTVCMYMFCYPILSQEVTTKSVIELSYRGGPSRWVCGCTQWLPTVTTATTVRWKPTAGSNWKYSGFVGEPIMALASMQM